jgi:hypothetical protein
MYSELVMYFATFVQGAGLFGAIAAISYVLEKDKQELEDFPADEEVEKLEKEQEETKRCFELANDWGAADFSVAAQLAMLTTVNSIALACVIVTIAPAQCFYPFALTTSIDEGELVVLLVSGQGMLEGWSAVSLASSRQTKRRLSVHTSPPLPPSI